jgi:hypothetical protein
MQMKVYKLYIAKPLLIFYLAGLATFVSVGVIGIIVATLCMKRERSICSIISMGSMNS